jgi:PAS domain S-box-containing protein
MRRWTRAVPWIGGVFIAAIIALAGYDIVDSYRTTVANTGRDLDAQARIIAEQTARSLQAVDVVLRYQVEQHRQGTLDAMSPRELHTYLRDQAVGLVQISGLVLVDASGAPRALSELYPVPAAVQDISGLAVFKSLSAGTDKGLYIGDALQSLVDRSWIFPLARRLETPAGGFAGGVGARGRVDYFEQFYRDARLDPSTTISLMRENGTLIARHPHVESALGKRFPLFDDILALHNSGAHAPVRAKSPIDGVERFASLKLVPDYPLAVIVTRDTQAALAPWRAQSIGTAVRTLALSALATLLLFMVTRQLSRLQRVRESLEVEQERFGLAVAGSNDGIVDWDVVNDRMFSSERAMEIVGIDSKDTVRTRAQWTALVNYHPDDLARMKADLADFLEGRTDMRDGEYRILLPGGDYRWIRHRNKCVRDASGRPIRVAGSVSDIDARKRAEDALRQSEERFALAVAGSNDGIMDWDIASDRMYTSERAMEILNIDSKETVRARMELRALLRYHPDDTPRVRADLDGLLEGRSELRDAEYRIDLGGGRYRWIRYRNKCVRDAAGRPVRVAGSVSDIDAQKRIEAALRSSEEQYKAIFDGSADALILRDAESRIVDVNPAFLELNGLTREQALSDRNRIFARPESQPLVRQMYGRTLAGETVQYELQFERKNGEPVHLDIRMVPVRYRGQAHSLSMARDITAQKRAQAALRESEERYQLAVAGANQGLWDWDLATDTMFVSARAQEFMGLAPSEPLRPRREWIAASPFHPDDIDGVRAAMSEHLHGRTRFYTVDYRMKHPSGNWHWYRQRGVALRDADGRPYRMAGSMEDITAQKDLEGQLLQAKKLEAIGTLAGGIAHDFNNILAAILGYGEMAQKGAAEGSALRRHVDAVVSAGLRAKSLVERILAFSRSGIAERKPVHVESVVAEALDLAAASLPKQVRLVRALVAGDAAVMAEATQIHQVVMNLCANGAQAMKSGGTLAVSLDVVDKTGSMAATSALPAGRYVRLVVRDTGTGIPARILERIFDPFFTTKDVGVGTGLGLSLVHGIVTELGGGVEVDGRPGEGAIFTVYLPLASAVAAPAPADEAVPEGSGETVLIVDDEEMLVRLGEEMVAGLGYEPVGFASSAAALESFRACPERFHAVLTDESMPELTGSDLIREIRKLRSDIPIVIMSGVVTPAFSARARELGATEVMAKPLAERELARSLAAAMHTHGKMS